MKDAVLGQFGIPTGKIAALLAVTAAIGGLVRGAIGLATATKDVAEQFDVTTGEAQVLDKAARGIGLR
ncbi:MAG: hypothetical protein AAB975_04465, partial [Patescibacteria group bacterium]